MHKCVLQYRRYYACATTPYQHVGIVSIRPTNKTKDRDAGDDTIQPYYEKTLPTGPRFETRVLYTKAKQFSSRSASEKQQEVKKIQHLATVISGTMESLYPRRLIC